MTNNIFEDIFKPLDLRNGTYFYRILGTDDEKKYNDTIAYLDYELKNYSGKHLLFKTGIENPTAEDIKRNNQNVNKINTEIKEALNIIINLANNNNDISSETIKNNFIAKMNYWLHKYVENIVWDNNVSPKCVYYGEIKKHEAYFLMLLALINFDVLYLNPQKEDIFSTIDKNHISEVIEKENISPTLSFDERLSKGVYIQKVTTYAKKASNELDESLYKDTGIYRPWQYIDGYTKPVLMNSIIEDMITYWDEPAKMRPGFKTENINVYVPVFLNKISGVYENQDEYIELVQKLRNTKHVYFTESTKISSNNFSNYEIYSLAFCLDKNKKIDKSILEKNKMYDRFKGLRSELSDFILDKIDELFEDKTLFKFKLDEKRKLRFISTMLSINENILYLIDNFDFTSYVPKLIMYLDKREVFTEDDALIVGYLHKLGFDILLLSPSRFTDIEMQISSDYLNTIRLQEAALNVDIYKMITKKKSFIQKILGQ